MAQQQASVNPGWLVGTSSRYGSTQHHRPQAPWQRQQEQARQSSDPQQQSSGTPPARIVLASASMSSWGRWGSGSGQQGPNQTQQQNPDPSQKQQQQQHLASNEGSASPSGAAAPPSTASSNSKPLPFAWALPPIAGPQSSSQRPFWLAPFGGGGNNHNSSSNGNGSSAASATSSGSSAAGDLQQQHQQHHQQHHQHHQHHGGPHIEVAKVAGIVAAQLLIHLANWQRTAAEHGEHMHSRMPWRHLRLPWQRGGGADAAGGAHGMHGAHAKHGHAWQSSEVAKKWIRQGVEHERGLRLREALSCYQSALALEPTNLEYICRVAKQYSDCTYEEGATAASVVEANSRAVEMAERAIALAPEVRAWF